jgi:hypothetical protein
MLDGSPPRYPFLRDAAWVLLLVGLLLALSACAPDAALPPSVPTPTAVVVADGTATARPFHPPQPPPRPDLTYWLYPGRGTAPQDKKPTPPKKP